MVPTNKKAKDSKVQVGNLMNYLMVMHQAGHLSKMK